MTYLALLMALIFFMAVIRFGGVAERSIDVVQTTRKSVAVMASPAFNDDEKEARIRGAAGYLLRSFVRIAFWSVLAIIVSIGVVAIGALIGFYRMDHAAAIAAGWPFILGAGAAMTAVWIVLDRYRSR